MIKEENIRISITLPKSIHKLLQDEAAYEDRKVANMAAKIIKDYYKAKNMLVHDDFTVNKD